MNDTVRVSKLRKLVDEAGGPAAFARKYSRKDADKPIDETYVSQILNGHRAFGERAARNMERRAGLPSGYFDEQPMGPKVHPSGASAVGVSDEALAVAREWDALPQSMRDLTRLLILLGGRVSTKRLTQVLAHLLDETHHARSGS